MPEEEICLKELGKGRGLHLKVGDTDFVALKLEGMKATNIGGKVTAVGVGAEGERVERNDWLIIVKDSEGIYSEDVWKMKAARAIANASGTYVNDVTLAQSCAE